MGVYTQWNSTRQIELGFYISNYCIVIKPVIVGTVYSTTDVLVFDAV